MTPEQRVQRVREVTERFAAGGPRWLLEHYDEVFTDDFLWKPSLVAAFESAEYRGRDGFARYLSDFESSFAEMTLRDASFSAVGDDTVIVKLTMSVRGTESGVPIDQHIGWVFRFEGDRVARGEAFLNWADAEAAATGGAHA